MRLPRFAIHLMLMALAAYAACVAPRSSFAQQPPSSTPGPKLQGLQELGDAYAKQAKVSLTRIEMTLAGKVAGDSTAWAKRLEEALAVGYAPEPGVFGLILFADVKPFMKVMMAGGRSPEETIKQVLTPGNVVAHVTWYLSGGDPIKSYAVFSPQGEPLFDTLLSLPLVRGRVFGTGH